MKRRYWKFALLLAVPLALCGYIIERNAWRPYTLALGGGSVFGLFFSVDGRYLIIEHDPNTVMYEEPSDDVLFFECETRQVVDRIPKANVCFFAGQKKIVVQQWTRGTFETQVYSLPPVKLLAQHSDFQNYTALPDGETLLGTSPGYSESVPRDVLAWNIVAHPKLVVSDNAVHTDTTKLKVYTQLPSTLRSPHALRSRTVVSLADPQILLIQDYYESSAHAQGTKVITQVWSIPQKKTLLRIEKIYSGDVNEADIMVGSPPRLSTVSGLFARQEDGLFKIWDYKKGDIQTTFPLKVPTPNTSAQSNPVVYSVTLSPDGALVAGALSKTPRSDTPIAVWDAKTGRFLQLLTGHKSSIVSLTFSPDSTTLASGSRDGTVKLWRIK